jgi:hypothetical protein
MTVLSMIVGGYALFLTLTGFAFEPSNVKANAFPNPLGIEVHIAASAFALLKGPWQFRQSVGIMLNHGDFYTPYRAIAWLCWVPNLIVAEMWLRRAVGYSRG